MIKRKKPLLNRVPRHLAIILDGNGRWAKKRGLARTEGHKKGAMNLKNIALFANELGIEVMSVYAFSTENWSRPQEEVDYLMKLPKLFEEQFRDSFKDNSIRVAFSGRRDRLSKANVDLLERIEKDTASRDGMTLNICLDYGSKDEIIRAVKEVVKEVQENKLPLDAIHEETLGKHLYTSEFPDVDYLIRTSGELRLSNFLLWQVAYAEFYFTKTPWPAFGRTKFLRALISYAKRQRRFGGLKG